MAERREALGGLVRRVREGLDRGRSSVRSASAAAPTPPRPYLEPLEPRILLSADVGLVPDALLAPPTDDFDPRSILEPAIHDEVLVREPSRFQDVDGEALEPEGSGSSEEIDGEGVAVSEEAASGESAEGASSDSQDTAAEVLRARVWQASLSEQAATEARTAAEVVVIDARIPEVTSLLEALLEGTEDAAADSRSDDAAASR
ncbi:MAG: LEPR-XLL domain-containing protein, partial [Deltaproteobacteria bacterium]|nr:LEPR-XLL domain-containing protein [Deltaproteobacteria bacterium]